jgi:hypothetical protein
MTVPWYFQELGQSVGPLTSEQLRRYAEVGRIGRQTLVRRGQDRRWVVARKVKGLFNRPAAALTSGAARGYTDRQPMDSMLNPAPEYRPKSSPSVPLVWVAGGGLAMVMLFAVSFTLLLVVRPDNASGTAVWPQTSPPSGAPVVAGPDQKSQKAVESAEPRQPVGTETATKQSAERDAQERAERESRALAEEQQRAEREAREREERERRERAEEHRRAEVERERLARAQKEQARRELQARLGNLRIGKEECEARIRMLEAELRDWRSRQSTTALASLYSIRTQGELQRAVIELHRINRAIAQAERDLANLGRQVSVARAAVGFARPAKPPAARSRARPGAEIA